MKENKKYEPEIDFKKLIQNPKRLFGWVFPYFFLVMLLLGVFYVKHLNTISVNTLPINAPVEDNVKHTIEAKMGSIMPPVDLDVIKNPSAELIANGKELFQKNCASCHGNSGMGDGAAGAALNPPPRNFTNDDGWTNGKEFPMMYKTLEEGITKNGMAAYEYLPPIERISLIQYIRTLGTFPEITDDQVQEVEATYHLTEGKATSNQIPVELAMEKVLSEKSNAVKISNVIEFVKNHPSMQGAEIFKKVVTNEPKIIESFLAANVNEINLDEFIQIVSQNFVEIGFNANVNFLEREEWQSLFSYIKNVLGAMSA